MSRRLVTLGYLTCLVVILVVRARSFHYIVDDAYISFRYARNLVHHGELTFNVGERVEGVTNLLWTVCLAIPEALAIAPETFASVAGMACGATLVLLTVFWCGRRGQLTFAEAWLVGLFLAVLAPLPLWSQSGMETAPFALLFLAVLFAGETLATVSSGLWVGLLAAIAFAIRPEGAFALAFVVLGKMMARSVRATARPLLAASMVLALGAASVTLFRWFYYGALVPNTFAAKRSFPRLLLVNGAEYALQFAWHDLLVPMALLIAFALANGRLAELARHAMRHPLIIATTLYVLYVVQAGGDWMPFARFFVPILPLCLVALVELARSIHVDLTSVRARPLVLGVLLALVVLERFGIDHERLVYNRDKLRPNLELVAEALNRLDSHPTIALTVAGLVPYRTGLPTVDLLGLSDRRIAHSPPVPYRSLPGHHKIDPGYVLDERKPDLIFLDMGSCVSSRPLPALKPWDLEKLLAEHPSFSAHYEISCLSVRDRFVNAYRRRDP